MTNNVLSVKDFLKLANSSSSTNTTNVLKELVPGKSYESGEIGLLDGKVVYLNSNVTSFDKNDTTVLNTIPDSATTTDLIKQEVTNEVNNYINNVTNINGIIYFVEGKDVTTDTYVLKENNLYKVLVDGKLTEAELGDATKYEVVYTFGTSSVVTPYTLPVATDSVLGGVMVGTGINVDSNGTISVNIDTTEVDTLKSRVDNIENVELPKKLEVINITSNDGSIVVTDTDIVVKDYNNLATKTDLDSKLDTSVYDTKVAEIDASLNKKQNTLVAGTNVTLTDNVDNTTIDVDLTSYVTTTDLTNELGGKLDKSVYDNEIAGINAAIATIGDKADTTVVEELSNKVTEVETNYVAADANNKNELLGLIGGLDNLSTTNKDTLVNAVNELFTTGSDLAKKVTDNTTNIGKNTTDIGNIKKKIDTYDTFVLDDTDFLTKKSYVDGLIADVRDTIANAGGAYITSDASGKGFETVDALKAGPWYSKGVVVNTLNEGDYTIVLKDDANGGASASYMYSTGIGWIFRYKVGSAFTSAQQSAIDSGITSTSVGTITTNSLDISKIKSKVETDTETYDEFIADTNNFLAKKSYVDTTKTEITTAYETADTALDNKITALQTKIDDPTTGYVAADTALSNRIDTLEGVDVDTKIATKIAEADTALETKVLESVANGYATKTELTDGLATKLDNTVKTELETLINGKQNTLVAGTNVTLTPNTVDNTTTVEVDLTTYATKDEVTALETSIDTKIDTKVGDISNVSVDLADDSINLTNVSNVVDAIRVLNRDSSKLVDGVVFTAGNGLVLNDKEFSVDNNIVAAKTDLDTVSNSLNELTNKVTTAETNIGNKADTTYVNDELAKKQNTLVSGNSGSIKLTNNVDNTTTIDIDLSTYAIKTDVDAVDTKVTEVDTKVTANTDVLNAIKGKIDDYDTFIGSTNKLADKEYVKELVASSGGAYITSTADGKGFDTVNALTTATTFYSKGNIVTSLNEGDYTIVLADENNGDVSASYMYYNSTWVFRYKVGTSFTADEDAAIKSSITKEKVLKIEENSKAIGTLTSLTTTKQDNLVNAINEVRADIDDITNPISTDLANLGTKVGNITDLATPLADSNATLLTVTNLVDAIKVLDRDTVKSVDVKEYTAGNGLVLNDKEFSVADTIATKDDVDAKIAAIDLTLYASKTDLDAKANVADLDNKADSTVVTDLTTKVNAVETTIATLATKDEVTTKVTDIEGRLDAIEATDGTAYIAADTALKDELNLELNKKANTTDLDAKADTTYVDNAIANIDYSNLAAKADLDNKADTTYVNDELAKKLNIADVDLTTYATKDEVTTKATELETLIGNKQNRLVAGSTDISLVDDSVNNVTTLNLSVDLSSLATKDEVDAKVAAVDLTSYATKDELANKQNTLVAGTGVTLTPNAVDNTTTVDVDLSTYATKDEVNAKADTANVYAKTDTYSQEEVNNLIAGLQDQITKLQELVDSYHKEPEISADDMYAAVVTL